MAYLKIILGLLTPYVPRLVRGNHGCRGQAAARRGFRSLTLLLIFLSYTLHAVNPNKIEVYLISDTHVDITSHELTNLNPPVGLSNDLDHQSFKLLISKIAGQIDKYPEINRSVILLGDLPAHNAYKLKTTRDNINLVFTELFQKTTPTPFFYVFGNNDSLQRNYGPFTHNGESAADLLKANTGNGDGFLSSGQTCPANDKPCIQEENTSKGYYSAYLGDHLKLISLNSVLFVSRPGADPSRDGAEEELQWLETELQTSRANHENVILAMHVSPQQWELSYKNTFKKIIKKYPEKIIAILAAHTHFDEIHAIKVEENVIPIVHSAGLSTDHGNASSFKKLTFERAAEAPWQFKTYVTYNFIGSNASTTRLNQYYDFMTSFCTNQTVTNVGTCLKSHIDGSGFDRQTRALMNEHYTAGNPNNQMFINPDSSWLSIYR